MKIKLILPLALTLLLSACGYTEPGGEYMVTTLALGEEPTGYRVILQAVDIKKGEQNGLPDTFTVEGRGKDVDDALEDAERGFSKGVALGHLNLIVLSDKVRAAGIRQVLEVSIAREVNLSAALAVCKDEKALLESGSPSAGTQLSSLIKQNYKRQGYGGHTALYEISTALLVNGGEFALPNIAEGPKVEGMLFYKEGQPQTLLDEGQSRAYAERVKGGAVG